MSAFIAYAKPYQCKKLPLSHQVKGQFQYRLLYFYAASLGGRHFWGGSIGTVYAGAICRRTRIRRTASRKVSTYGSPDSANHGTREIDKRAWTTRNRVEFISS
jgi:hypothetical protein